MIILSFSACLKSADKTNNGAEQNSRLEQSEKVSGAELRKEASSDAQEEELPTKDPQGNDIKIPENINAIAAMAPAIVEILVELGLGDKIVAIELASVGIEGVREDAMVFDMMAPDVEKLISLKPDILFASTISQLGGSEDPFKPLQDVGICVAYIPTSNTIEDIKNDIMFIAKATKTADKGRMLIDNMEKEIEKISNIAKTITEKKKVYFEIAAAPTIYSFGKGVFLNEMIELVGAENVFADQTGWMSVAPEVAVATDPDVILTNVNYIEDPVAEIKSRDGWQDMKAIKNGAVYYIDNMASSLPNYNIIKALWQIAKAVYPDKY
ncbi:MAG TPA: ABC transporter substrate-binding protein [Clostridiaceae bacterium]|nr:ABC transporter substrate-binding protein [Clostridiaceae bacterium]